MKDDRIDKLFSEYAEDFKPNENLTNKAHAQMKKPHKKRISMRVVGALCCVFIVCITLAVLTPILLDQNGSYNNNPSYDANRPPSIDNSDEMGGAMDGVTYYQRYEVQGNLCGASDIEWIDMSAIKSVYEIVSEKYYAFYLDDELVYYVATFGIVQEDGIYEVNLIIEKDGYVRQDLRDEYYSYMSNHISSYYGDLQNGEYVTKAYLQANGVHYYLQIKGNDTYSMSFVDNILGQN